MQQSRKQLRTLKAEVRNGDAEAARLLLAHSVTLGQDRLSIRRYFVARALGTPHLDRFKAFGQTAARRMPTDDILALARDACRRIGQHKDIHLMAAELLSATPYQLPYDETEPCFLTEPRFCGVGSSVLGKAEIGARAALAPDSVIRADGHFVRIGDDFHLGENATVHIAHDVLPAIIGNRVTAGRNTVVHACTVGDDCVIEDDVVILDGSIVADRVLIESGSTVFPRSVLRSDLVYAGNPARPVRDLARKELDDRQSRLREAIAASLFSLASKALSAEKLREDVFVAETARLIGRVEMGARSSVFFSCHLDAGPASITIGTNTNIQDNSRIRCCEDTVSIGRDTTIGHNVQMQDCRIGERSLIGIGSILGAGTAIDDDVLLAAGAITSEGQYLERGWLWGGRPARRIAKLDDAKRAMLGAIIQHYCAYADEYRTAQHRLRQQGGANGTSPFANCHSDR